MRIWWNRCKRIRSSTVAVDSRFGRWNLTAALPPTTTGIYSACSSQFHVELIDAISNCPSFFYFFFSLSIFFSTLTCCCCCCAWVDGTNCLNWKIAGAAFVRPSAFRACECSAERKNPSSWQLCARFDLVLPNGTNVYILHLSFIGLHLGVSFSALVAIKSIFDWCQYYYHFIMAIYLSGRAAAAAHSINSFFPLCSCCLLRP